MRGHRTIRTAKTRQRILAALTRGWSIHGACEQAGIGRQSFYDWKADDALFRAEADAAIECATDRLEDVARNRAIDHSDLLLIFLLRSRRPHIYNQKQTVLLGGDQNAPPVSVHATGDPDEVVHFYMPTNFRDRPEELEADAQRTIEGHAEDAA